METIKIDFAVQRGPIKRMNAVNNGPTAPNVRTPKKSNFDLYKALDIPYARNHDASFYQGYGGEHTVDVHRIFKNFDADENDPANYIFEPTDGCVLNTFAAGTKVFYRLGASIEHYYKYGVRVPKNFKKWARICEHIIRHYNEGWANGYKLGIEYWEIWNEPDICPPSPDNACWQGDEDQFVDLYCTAAKHLKERFPHLKIGGPAFANPFEDEFQRKLFEGIKKTGAPLDFYSYHCYARDINWFGQIMTDVRAFVDKNGFPETETILDEWNYIDGWVDEKWKYSVLAEQNLKGASFLAGAMAVGQASPLDMLMYYDARPGTMNGIFTDDHKPRKGYYCYTMFKRLKDLGTYVPHERDGEDVFVCTATDGNKHAIMLTYFNNDKKGLFDVAYKAYRDVEDTPDEVPFIVAYHDTLRLAKQDKVEGIDHTQVTLDLKHIGAPAKIAYYCLDDLHNDQLVREETIGTDNATLAFDMELFSTYLIEITPQ